MSSDQADPHASFIKTPKQLIILVALAFVVPVLVIWMLASFVGGGGNAQAQAQAQQPEAVAERLAPVGQVAQKAEAGAQALASGSDVYAASCAGCHSAGVLGAPKVGDVAGWKTRIAQGFDTLVKNATNGIRAMPPKGGNAALDPKEVARAVAYMANESGAQFKAP